MTFFKRFSAFNFLISSEFIIDCEIEPYQSDTDRDIINRGHKWSGLRN